ncbi:MAG: nicotinate (nicotinamide) nucleotide adenylyltransferase [bacterium]
MNITVFSGTFNPIHTGHLIIAESVREELKQEKILFIPAYSPPHRAKDIAIAEHRLYMTNLAIADNPFFEASDIEFNLKERRKSYSYFTVKKLFEENTDISGKINFIVGSDAFSLIDSWHEAEKLAELVNFVIVARYEKLNFEELFEKIKLKHFSYQLVKAPVLEISSSSIRDKIKRNKSIKYLVPKTVEEYIHENSLYYT